MSRSRPRPRPPPVDVYIGGIEHAILHLLYARFICAFLMGSKLAVAEGEEAAEFSEPFRRLVTQGMVHGKTYSDPTSGRFLKPDEVDLSDPSHPRVAVTGKRSQTSAMRRCLKSKHNGVDPTECIARRRVDVTRAHMLFQAPVPDVLNWDDDKINGHQPMVQSAIRAKSLQARRDTPPAAEVRSQKLYIEESFAAPNVASAGPPCRRGCQMGCDAAVSASAQDNHRSSAL